MKRREFIKMLVLSAAAAVGGFCVLARHAVQAARPGRFPGRLKEFSRAGAGKPGHWAG